MMKHRSGISGRVFKALGRNGVNVAAIAQGSSELNISIVVGAQDRGKAMSAIHDAFFLSGVRTVNVFLVGRGLIGGTLLRQISAQQARLLKDHSIRVRIAGVANSRKMLTDPKGIDAASWRETLEERGQETDLPLFLKSLRDLNLPNACFCDCTASDAPVKHYEDLLSTSISVVTPNKRANSGPLQSYERLMMLSRSHDVSYRYETTVGAGLPVIGTIHDLVASGDDITRIEAVVSGTISYIFNNLDAITRFSDLVKNAKSIGYNEPDPREDLSAQDIARKAIILGREAGYRLSESTVRIDPLMPAGIAHAASVEQCLSLLPEMDEAIEALRKSAAQKGKVLRYAASVTAREAFISLREYGPESPFYSLTGTDNMVAITSKRYPENPLVIRGPGAGAEVTAGGVFADILKSAESYL
jgi:aspartokinase/homoserine dehydrogenase 1